MFSHAPAPSPRPPTGLRRGGPVHIHEVMPAAIDRLARQVERRTDPPGPAPRPPPRWPTLPRAA